jgi:hypothetical protein
MPDKAGHLPFSMAGCGPATHGLSDRQLRGHSLLATAAVPRSGRDSCRVGLHTQMVASPRNWAAREEFPTPVM